MPVFRVQVISLFEREGDKTPALRQGKRASRKGRVQGEDEVSTQNMPKSNIKLCGDRRSYCGPSLSEQ